MSKGLFHPYRFQIYVCDLGENEGSVQGGKRPVLIIQSNAVNSSTVIVAPITSSIKKTNMVSHIILSDASNFSMESMVVLEQLRTVNVSALECYCGFIHNRKDIKNINEGIKRTLGIWSSSKKAPEAKTKTERKQIRLAQNKTCLCYQCLSSYINNPEYSVRRLSAPRGAKDTCDRCGFKRGFDYLITEIKE